MSSSERDLNLTIIGEDLTRAATDGAGDNFDRLGKKVDGFGKTVHRSTGAAGKDVDQLSRLLKDFDAKNGSAFKAVQGEIEATEKKLKSLRSEFGSSGSKQSLIDIKDTEADLKTLLGFADALSPGLSKAFAAAGKDGEQSLLEGFSDTPIGPAIAAFLIGPATAVIGAAVATALTAGLGFGFLAAGAVILHGNKDLVAKFGTLKSDLGSELSDAASPLVQPFEEALGRIDALVKNEQPAIGKIFAAVAPSVDSIETIIEDFVQKIVPELAPIAASFSAAFDDPQVRGQIAVLETQVGQLFDLVAANKQTVVETFAALTATVNLAVAAVNALLVSAKALDTIWHATGIPQAAANLGQLVGATHSASTEQGKFAVIADAANTALDAQKIAAQKAAAAAAAAAPDYADLATQIGQVIQTQDTLAGAMTDHLLGALLNSDNATSNFNKSLITLGDTLVSNGGHLSDHVRALKKSETGAQQNKDAVLAVVQANLQVYDSQIAVGISAEDAAKKYDSNTRALKDQLTAAGYTKTQIHNLIGQYEQVPDKVNTSIAVDGLTTAITDLDTLLRKLLGLPPKKTVNVEVDYHTKGKSGLLGAYATTNAAGSSWSAIYTGMGGVSDRTGSTQPAREPVSMTANVTSHLILNGRVISAVSQRAIAHNNRRQKVGTR